MDDEKEPMPVLEKTVQQPPPLPAGSILGAEKPVAAASAPKPSPAPVPAAAAPSPATTHAIAAVQAAAVIVSTLPDQTRNIQTALRMLNDATGLLQKA
jgi:hypothetical protein